MAQWLSVNWSCRVPKFSSQHPQLPVALAPGAHNTSDLCRHWYLSTHACMHINTQK